MGGSRLKTHAAVTARTLTAFVGGYAAAAALCAAGARVMPLPRAEAVGWAMIVSFLVYAVILLWGLREPSLPRVLGWTWGTAAAAALACWLLGARA